MPREILEHFQPFHQDFSGFVPGFWKKKSLRIVSGLSQDFIQIPWAILEHIQPFHSDASGFLQDSGKPILAGLPQDCLRIAPPLKKTGKKKPRPLLSK